MADIKTIVLTCAIVALCEAYAVVEKTKCSLSDGDCQVKLIRRVVEDIAVKGDNDLGIPTLDPYVLKNFDFSLLGLLQFTIVEGKAAGLKNCNWNSFKIDIEGMHIHISLTCDTFHVEGKHTISTLPAFDTLVGGLKVHGDGDMKADIEKANLDFDFAFEIVKLDDGEYHILLKSEESTHKLDITGTASFDFTNVLVGSQDISTVLNAILNENWKIINKLFGESVMEKIMGVVYEFVEKFLKGIPAKELFSDDLSKYVKN